MVIVLAALMVFRCKRRQRLKETAEKDSPADVEEGSIRGAAGVDIPTSPDDSSAPSRKTKTPKSVRFGGANSMVVIAEAPAPEAAKEAPAPETAKEALPAPVTAPAQDDSINDTPDFALPGVELPKPNFWDQFNKSSEGEGEIWARLDGSVSREPPELDGPRRPPKRLTEEQKLAYGLYNVANEEPVKMCEEDEEDEDEDEEDEDEDEDEDEEEEDPVKVMLAVQMASAGQKPLGLNLSAPPAPAKAPSPRMSEECPRYDETPPEPTRGYPRPVSPSSPGLTRRDTFTNLSNGVSPVDGGKKVDGSMTVPPPIAAANVAMQVRQPKSVMSGVFRSKGARGKPKSPSVTGTQLTPPALPVPNQVL